jgi:hypothetical protein
VPWYKVDDTFHSHPKSRRSGLEAVGLWTVSGSHCMAYKADGFVPEWFVRSWPKGKRLADVLVREGLWKPEVKDGEPGWQFHDWADYQPTSEEIEADRVYARDRQRRRRAKLRAARQSGDAP